LFVVENEKEAFKETLLDTIHETNSSVEVVLGDDDSYFYHFRPPGKLIIDVEVFERDETFYSRYRLLGYSVFCNYVGLFTATGYSLDELIAVPQEPLSRPGRLGLLLDDRKGLREFVTRVKGSVTADIDPRRILTITVQNLAWGISGFRTPTVELALAFLRGSGAIAPEVERDVNEILDLDERRVQAEYASIKHRTLAALEAMQTCAEDLLRGSA